MAIETADMLFRMGASVVLGGAIGYEREKAGRPAGLRTHLLVSLASSTFMIVSAHFGYYQGYTEDSLVSIDPSRIGSNILTGVGFLGGGAILRSGLNVRGLTTAASLWLVAALGMAAGAGMFAVACSACGLALFCLVALRRFDASPFGSFKRRITIVISDGGSVRETVLARLHEHALKTSEVGSDFDRRSRRHRLRFDVRLADDAALTRLTAGLYDLAGVERVKVARVA